VPQLEPFVNPNGTISNVLTPVGLAVYEGYPYINASETNTNGIDLDFKSAIDLGEAGRLTGELNYTRILTFTLSAPGVSYELAGTHGPSGFSGDTGNPKNRAVLSLTWDKGPVSLTGSVNYVGSFSVTDPSSGQSTCEAALNDRFISEYGGGTFPSGSIFPSSFCRVASFTDVDFYGRYSINDHLSFHASVLNALDKPPPLDMATYGGGGGAAYDAAMTQAGAVGRYFILGAAYKF
jgi:iron complex outermembrane receptor protein